MMADSVSIPCEGLGYKEENSRNFQGIEGFQDEYPADQGLGAETHVALDNASIGDDFKPICDESGSERPSNLTGDSQLSENPAIEVNSGEIVGLIPENQTPSIKSQNKTSGLCDKDLELKELFTLITTTIDYCKNTLNSVSFHFSIVNDGYFIEVNWDLSSYSNRELCDENNKEIVKEIAVKPRKNKRIRKKNTEYVAEPRKLHKGGEEALWSTTTDQGGGNEGNADFFSENQEGFADIGFVAGTTATISITSTSTAENEAGTSKTS
jgi:hypothetical protein